MSRMSHQVRTNARRGYATGGLLVLSMLLASCGGGASTPSTTPTLDPTATAAPQSPTPVPSPEFGDIVWTRSIQPGTNAPGDPVRTFKAGDQKMFAVVRVTNVPAGTVLSASWSYNNVPLDRISAGVVPPSMYSAGYVSFVLSKADSTEWPAGTYAISVTLDGKPVQTSQIEVDTQ